MTKNYVEGLDGGNGEVIILAAVDVDGKGFTLFERRIPDGFSVKTEWVIVENIGDRSHILNIFDDFPAASKNYFDLCVLRLSTIKA